MEPKGNVWIGREFKYTTRWPSEQLTLNGWVDLEKEYKEALAGRLCVVMDIAVDGSSYLVIAKTTADQNFIWEIDKRDTKGFIPVIKKYGIVIPAGLSPMEEFKFMAEYHTNRFDREKT